MLGLAYRSSNKRADNAGLTTHAVIMQLYMSVLKTVLWNWKNGLRLLCAEQHGRTV
jgi:hypothetical protein